MAIDTFKSQATVDASGNATVTFGPPGPGRRWEVRQVAIAMIPAAGGLPSAPGGATARIQYDDGFPISPMIPSEDAAGGDPPIPLRGGEKMLVKWAGCTAGDMGRVTVIYDDGNPAK